MDAVPGRTTTLWFDAKKPGRYRLFCAEYCGMKHSGMIGSVIVMEPAAFQAWLAGGAATGSMADAGQKLFTDLACVTCHREDSTGRGPTLRGLFASTVKLQTGSTVKADENYIRESILNPQAKIVEGYQPLMPTFQGLVSEEQLMQLTAYVKSLGTPGAAAQAPAGSQAAPAGEPARQ
jgi:cytochrome c oxidase subunit 2